MVKTFCIKAKVTHFSANGKSLNQYNKTTSTFVNYNNHYIC